MWRPLASGLPQVLSDPEDVYKWKQGSLAERSYLPNYSLRRGWDVTRGILWRFLEGFEKFQFGNSN